MAELRSVDPRVLRPNPNNPRKTRVPPAMDAQLLASVKAIGVIEKPSVTEYDDGLTIEYGHRRVWAAIEAGLPRTDVIVYTPAESNAMHALAENLVRAPMGSVDIWRAIEQLETQGWNEQAIADALAFPLRTVRRLKLLAHLHPAMLDVMALGSMPNEEQLRTIALASREEQAQVWKKHKPRKGQEIGWWEIAHALSKRRMPASAAQFGDDLAKAYGVVWEDDLFAPAGEDSRTTTNVEGFFGAQQEWLQKNLPERGTLLPVDDYGQGQLPKKAERIYSKPGKADLIGHYIDVRSGEIKTIAYRLPDTKPAGKAAGGQSGRPGANDDGSDLSIARTRPDVTQKGVAMIGDLRTEALHQALADTPIEDDTLLGMLILAFGGDNVTVDSGSGLAGDERRALCHAIAEGGVLTGDRDLLRQVARQMLIGVLSCRENRSQSGVFARIAGEAIGASLHLPNMATEEFLGCLSRGALETVAKAEEVNIAPRAKDTRARLVARFKDGVFVYPAARFQPTPEELAAARRAHVRPGWAGPVSGEAAEGGEENESLPWEESPGESEETGFDNDDLDNREAA